MLASQRFILLNTHTGGALERREKIKLGVKPVKIEITFQYIFIIVQDVLQMYYNV